MMAHGFKSIHPRTQEKLEALGLGSEAVTQGYGEAKASAGFHESMGEVDGHGWSPCVDLSPEYVSYNRGWLSRLVNAGIAPFGRNSANGWRGSEHWHCIDVALKHLLVGVETQVHDFCNGRNGLAGHADFDGPLAPDFSQQQAIRDVYLTSDPRPPVQVLDTRGAEIDCYGFVEESTARIEVRPLIEHVGGIILSPREYRLDGRTVDFGRARPAVSGELLRANLRGMADCLGLGIAVDETPTGIVARLRRS